jgi:hypothetical protein
MKFWKPKKPVHDSLCPLNPCVCSQLSRERGLRAFFELAEKQKRLDDLAFKLLNESEQK